MSRASRQARLEQVETDEAAIKREFARIVSRIETLQDFYSEEPRIFLEINDCSVRIKNEITRIKNQLWIDAQDDSSAAWGRGVSPRKREGALNFRAFMNQALSKFVELSSRQVDILGDMAIQARVEAVGALDYMQIEVSSLLQAVEIKADRMYDVLNARNDGFSSYRDKGVALNEVGLFEAHWTNYNDDVIQARLAISSLDERLESQEIIKDRDAKPRRNTLNRARDEWNAIEQEIADKYSLYKESRVEPSPNTGNAGAAPFNPSSYNDQSLA